MNRQAARWAFCTRPAAAPRLRSAAQSPAELRARRRSVSAKRSCFLSSLRMSEPMQSDSTPMLPVMPQTRRQRVPPVSVSPFFPLDDARPRAPDADAGCVFSCDRCVIRVFRISGDGDESAMARQWSAPPPRDGPSCMAPRLKNLARVGDGNRLLRAGASPARALLDSISCTAEAGAPASGPAAPSPRAPHHDDEIERRLRSCLQARRGVPMYIFRNRCKRSAIVGHREQSCGTYQLFHWVRRNRR